MRDRHKTITPTNKKLPVFFSMKNTGSFACAPAVSKSRTRRPGAGLSAPAGSSPAMQLVVCRLPTKRFALSASSPRGCAGQAALRVCFFAQPRTHARLRRASRAPGLFLCPTAHARGWFRVRAHAWLLFSRAGRDPVFCSLRPGKSPRQISDLKRITWGHPFPHAQKRLKS